MGSLQGGYLLVMARVNRVCAAKALFASKLLHLLRELSQLSILICLSLLDSVVNLLGDSFSKKVMHLGVEY